MAGGMLITGASGQVGGELLRLFPGADAPGRDTLDLAETDSIRETVQRLRPRWILNPAAYTAVDRAESEPEAARAVNTEAVRVLGEEARRLGAAVVHFSTDYVFAGEGTTPYVEDDPCGPQGVYGATKLAGERALAATGAAHLIFRTSWVYGATGKNFLLTVLRVARERAEMRIVDDQHGAPTAAADLARMVRAAVDQCEDRPGATAADKVQPLSGVYHACAAGETTWFGFASRALDLRRLAEPHTRFATLVPIPTRDYPTPARRPPNSRMDCSKLARTFGCALPPWGDALASVLAEVPVVAAAAEAVHAS